MKSFLKWCETLTALQNGAPSWTELKGVAFVYDEKGVHELGQAGPPEADQVRIVGRYDPQEETVSVVVPQRLARKYSDSALANYIDTVVVPDLQKKYRFRQHYVYK